MCPLRVLLAGHRLQNSTPDSKAHWLTFFFPRVRTPCGHGAQVIIEGGEIQSDGGEKDKDNPTTSQTKPTTAHRPRLHHQAVFPLYWGETSETMTADDLWA